MIKNQIAYDKNGRIKSVTDNGFRTYGFVYNVFGEPTKYFENGKLIVEKGVTKGIEYDEIEDKVYNDIQDKDGQSVIVPFITKTKIDKYGRIISQENDNKNVQYQYQSDIKESESVGKIHKIIDPYENQNYIYQSDEDNRPYGYETTGNPLTGANKIRIRQIAAGDTQYHFNNEDKYLVSKIIKEDSEYSPVYGNKPRFDEPRIIKTKYADMDSENSEETDNNYKVFSYKYHYDPLGRLITKTSDKIEKENGLFIYTEKDISYKTSTTIPSQIKYTTISEDINGSDKATITYGNTYDCKGNLTSMLVDGKRFVNNPINEDNVTTSNLIKTKYVYLYDALDRLTCEEKFENEISKEKIEYDYSQTSDKLRKVTSSGVNKEFTYNNGRKTAVKLQNRTHNIYYDNYGNITKDEKGTLSYNSRNLLSSYFFYDGTTYNNNSNYNKSNYSYNYQGVRFRKKLEKRNGNTTETNYVNYYLDGSRILGEDKTDASGNTISSMRYFYDAEGIAGLRYDGYNFHFLKDSLGNVSMVMYEGKVIGQYLYDAWGNCEVVALSIANDRDSFVLNNNPFRWKSHYLDVETGLYYVNGRYYSTVLMEYLDADSIENINPTEINALNRHAITLDNSITYEVNEDTIFTNNELYPDPEYDPLRDKSWWALNWKKALQWIAFSVVLVVTIVLMCVPATSAFGVGMFVAGLKAAASGALIGGLIGGIMSAINGNSFMEGLVEGAVYGFINGFTTGALMFCASQAASALSKAASNRCTSPGSCFVAGTVVLTTLGNKPIEDIEVGDEVWAYDEETGDKALKKVVQLFRNTSNKWLHLSFEYETGNTEEIVCTEGHPFYVNNLGWVTADKLLANDEI